MKLVVFSDWFIKKSKIWIIRILALLLSFFALLISFEFLSKEYLKIEYIFSAIFLLLWLIFETFISIDRSSILRDRGLKLSKWDESIPEIKRAITNARNSIKIFSSSTESIYVPLIETFEMCKNIEIQIIMRRRDLDDKERIVRLNYYKKRWESLNSNDKNVSVKVKYHKSDLLRGLLIDVSVGFLGFYERISENKLWGHSVPVMHVNSGKTVDDYFMKIYLNRFDKMWEEAKENE